MKGVARGGKALLAAARAVAREKEEVPFLAFAMEEDRACEKEEDRACMKKQAETGQVLEYD